MIKKLPDKWFSLACLSLLTLLFVVWQISILFSESTQQLMMKVIWGHHVHLPFSLLMLDVRFLLMQLLIYIGFTVFIWLITIYASRLLRRSVISFGFLVWFCSILFILLANRLWYPNSVFSEFLLWCPDLSVKIVLTMLGIFLLSICIAALIQLILDMNRLWRFILVLFIVIGSGFLIFYHSSILIQRDFNRPNVIIIGIDSLRPDHVGYYGAPFDDMPHLDKFLRQSTNFDDAITPLARTFVAWTSILTGQYPKHNGVRFNLVAQDHLKLNNTLAAILRCHGYQTIYGSDDMRFSNISKRFGFDRIIGVHAGANDFLLGSVNDFPLSNMLMDSAIGEWMFPYSFANRGASNTYDPSEFNARLKQALKSAGNKPLFLAVHFCLPHWPYAWRSPVITKNATGSVIYREANRRVDQQIAAFVKLLREHHLLHNAIVVVLSDHGETFGEKGDRLISKSHYVSGAASRKDVLKEIRALWGKQSDFSASTGHGTDVLSYPQYHVVLAFRGFGREKNIAKNVRGLTSLIDIKPTVLSWLHIASPETDGQSLLPYIAGDRQVIPARMIFAETGFTPTAIRHHKISVRKLLYHVFDVFKVDPKTGRILFRKSMAKKMMPEKQRAVYYKNWLLAFYPDLNHRLIPIFLNRKTGLWTDDLSVSFVRQAPVAEMLYAIKQFYGSEVTDYL